MTLRAKDHHPPRLVTRTLGPVKLDLDDLNDLLSLMRSRTYGDMSMEVGRYEADSIEDFAWASDADIASVRLSSHSPAVQVSLAPDNARVWTQSDDPAASRLVEDIADQVNKRPRSRKIVYPWHYLVVLSLVLALSIFCFVLAATSETSGFAWIVAVFGLALFLIAVVRADDAYRLNGAVELVPLRRPERRTKDAAHRRQLGVAVAGTTVGAALGVIGTLIVTLLSRPSL